jgi:hypothetical protein
MPQWLFRKITSSFTNEVCEPVYILYIQMMLIIQNIFNTLNNEHILLLGVMFMSRLLFPLALRHTL